MTKIKAEDKWFSLYVRARDGWTCQRCFNKFEPYREGMNNSHLKGLHCMHMFSRGKYAVRHDEKNGLSGCYGCHKYLDGHRDEKEALWKSKIGSEEFEALENRSHDIGTRSKRVLKEISKEFRLKFREVQASHPQYL